MIWDKFFGSSAPDAPAAKQAELPLGMPDLVSAETLGALAADVDLQLKAIEQLILQSGQDARRFSRSLKQGAADLSNPERAAQALTHLVDLTRDMVEKTRAAEAQLRHQTDAMARISDGLETVRQTKKGVARFCATGWSLNANWGRRWNGPAPAESQFQSPFAMSINLQPSMTRMARQRGIESLPSSAA